MVSGAAASLRFQVATNSAMPNTPSEPSTRPGGAAGPRASAARLSSQTFRGGGASPEPGSMSPSRPRLAWAREGKRPGKATPELARPDPPSPPEPTTPLPAGGPAPPHGGPRPSRPRDSRGPRPRPRPSASPAPSSFQPAGGHVLPRDALRSPTGLAGRGRRDGGKMAAEAGYWRRLPQSRSRRR